MIKAKIPHSPPAPPRRGGGDRGARIPGFTLVEVLVTLAITGMLISVLASSLFHILRAQDALHDETVTRERQLRERAWFREIVAGCLPEERGDARAFVGDQQEIRCETTGSILPTILPSTAVVRLVLTPEDFGVTLKYEEGDGRSTALFSQKPGSAEFKYVDAAGMEQDSWPPGGANNELLPSQVRLVFTLPMTMGAEPVEGSKVWLAVPKSDPWEPERPPLPPGITWDMLKK